MEQMGKTIISAITRGLDQIPDLKQLHPEKGAEKGAFFINLQNQAQALEFAMNFGQNPSLHVVKANGSWVNEEELEVFRAHDQCSWRRSAAAAIRALQNADDETIVFMVNFAGMVDSCFSKT